MLNHIDLCSGIGGFALGFQWANLSKPILFCDTDEWCRELIGKHWPNVPIEEDVKVLANEPNRIPLKEGRTILTAGYPCQPFSQAGKRRGTEDDRHIWPYIRKIVTHQRPSWCVFENVYGHISMGLDQVLSDLETDGYTSRTFIVPAAGVDAPHKRDRVWIVARNMADSNNEGLRPRVRGAVSEFIQKNDERCDHTGGVRNNDSDQNGEPSILSKNEETLADTTLQLSHERLNPNRSKEIGQSGVRSKIGRGSEDVANTKSEGLQDVGGCSELVREQDRRHLLETSSSATGTNFWEPEPNVGRVANGIPQRVDRLKALGNAIVPQIAMRIAFTIKEIEAQQK